MRTRIFLIFIVSIIYQSCNSVKNDFFNEKDYVITKTEFFEGHIDKEIYTNKNDTSRKMKKYYHGNGVLMAKCFTNKMKTDGEFEIFSIDGKIIMTHLYKDGVKLSTKRSKPIDTTITIFRNGKLEKLHKTN
jgi:antitoxin component YwqK of YwqJK toxin-antitoxin module